MPEVFNIRGPPSEVVSLPGFDIQPWACYAVSVAKQVWLLETFILRKNVEELIRFNAR